MEDKIAYIIKKLIEEYKFNEETTVSKKALLNFVWKIINERYGYVGRSTANNYLTLLILQNFVTYDPLKEMYKLNFVKIKEYLSKL